MKFKLKTPDKINGKTPKEIKRGLECWNCDCCSYSRANNDGEARCGDVEIDALAYIQQLERERDEARSDVDKLSHAVKEATDNYYAMLRERDAAVQAVENAVEVVRCKDCDAFRNSPFGHSTEIIGWCKLEGEHHRPNYYCAKGSRKND